MVKRYVKWAVGLALAEGGDDERARKHLGRLDPLVRSRARRALQNQVEAILGEDPNAATGRPMLEKVAQRLGVETSGRRNQRTPFWWATAIGAILVFAGVGIFAYRQATATSPVPFDPRAAEEIAESKGAYQRGGRPLSLGEPGRTLFGRGLTELVIALDRTLRQPGAETSAALTTAEKSLLSDENRALVGDQVFTALSNLVDACKATLIDGEYVQGDADELNAALARAGLAYYIDEDIFRHAAGTTPLLYVHAVDRVRIFDIKGGEPQRVLWLRRLDALNLRSTSVGSTHDGASAAVVRLDLIDHVVQHQFLPVLAPDARYSLWPIRPGEKPTPSKDRVETLAGTKMRDELHAVGVDVESGARLAELLKKRSELFDVLKRQAQSAGFKVAIPEAYRIDMSHYRPLEASIGKGILRNLADIDEELAGPKMGAVYSTVRSAYIETVEHHEIRHRLDRGHEDRVPPGLRLYVGEAPASDSPSRFSRRLVTEYSAFLAEIAHSRLPYASLIRLSKHALDYRSWNTTYAETSVGAISRLAAEADIEHHELVADRSVDRDKVARLLIALLGKPRAELQAMATAAWEAEFESRLLRPARRTSP